ncbi:hypothetical protein EYV94_25125 [Puteibacter caeruleilacunae]|nr:hypothetical protein EYV94_25125 [Puteibacter caeruleilacunae]
MYKLSNRNILEWIVFTSVEYLAYMFIISIFFVTNKYALLGIIAVAAISIVNDYNILKKSEGNFDYLSKRLFFLHKSVYRKNLLFRLLFVLGIVILLSLNADYNAGNEYVGIPLQFAGMFIFFNYKHVYGIKPKSNIYEKAKFFIESKQAGGVISSSNDTPVLYVTKNDLKELNTLIHMFPDDRTYLPSSKPKKLELRS